MVRGTKSKSLTLPCNGLLQILHLSQVLEASDKGVGDIIERLGAGWMARGTKSKGFMIPRSGLLQILHLSQLIEASDNRVGEVVERSRASWMARGTKSKSFTIPHDGLLQILHLSQLLKPFIKSYCQVAQQASTLGIPLRTAQNVLSTVRNHTIQTFLAIRRLLNTTTTYLACIRHYFL
jgi:hypothetical protein